MKGVSKEGGAFFLLQEMYAISCRLPVFNMHANRYRQIPQQLKGLFSQSLVERNTVPAEMRRR